MARELTERVIVESHLAKVCEEAGLDVMFEVYIVVLDRENDQLDVTDWLAIDAAMVEADYTEVMGAAVDEIELRIVARGEPK